jgi:hypothetical protein
MRIQLKRQNKASNEQRPGQPFKQINIRIAKATTLLISVMLAYLSFTLYPQLIDLYQITTNLPKQCSLPVLTQATFKQCQNSSYKIDTVDLIAGSLTASPYHSTVISPNLIAKTLPNQKELLCPDFKPCTVIFNFNNLKLIEHHLYSNSSGQKDLVQLRRSLEQLRHIKHKTVVLLLHANSTLNSIPDKLIKEAGRIRLWDIMPKSPYSLIKTQVAIYGRLHNEDIPYDF